VIYQHRHVVRFVYVLAHKPILSSHHQHDRRVLTQQAAGNLPGEIENGSTKADIARTIGKDATTVAKEIRRHRQLKPRNPDFDGKEFTRYRLG
jgi:IS30 family transposase